MKLGDINVYPVSDGFFKLDGGAMFGIIPKVLWEKRLPADEYNRIQLGLWCLLIQAAGKNILVDTGLGPDEQYSRKFRRIYVVQHPPSLLSSLAQHGLQPEDIDIVINTHLHFDHAGGNTLLEKGRYGPAFPKARYIIQKDEWDKATQPNTRTRGSYYQENFLALKEHGLVQFIDGDQEILPGLRVRKTGGHTRGHQVVLFESKGRQGVYWSDLIPTTAHIDLPYTMSYDLYPEEVIGQKKDLIEQAIKEEWLCFWEHDPRVNCGYLQRKDGRVAVAPLSL